ncbi:hypothetical protein BX600DRAFT_555465 [Xylariales sp. PMI_506]|nr:hypothetical protein BX600DRAFT_555465 [Xylariales sp. PMI_506]
MSVTTPINALSMISEGKKDYNAVMQQMYQDQCQEFRQQLIHKFRDTVEHIFEELEHSLIEPGSQPSASPMLRTSVNLAPINVIDIEEAYTPCLKAPEADMGVTEMAPRNTGSTTVTEDTPSLGQTPLKPTNASSYTAKEVTSQAVCSSSSAPTQSFSKPNKRPIAANVPLTESPRKRQKRHVYAKEIRRGLLKPREHSFRYQGFEGEYVIRCNRTTCKEISNSKTIFFQCHPFKTGKAMDHFGGPGHNIKSEEQIFMRYAYKVVDDVNGLGNETPDPTVANAPVTPPSRPQAHAAKAPAEALLTPPSSVSARGKGKQIAPTSVAGSSSSLVPASYSRISPRPDGSRLTAKRTAPASAPKPHAGTSTPDVIIPLVGRSDGSNPVTVISDDEYFPFSTSVHNIRRQQRKSYRDATRDEINVEFEKAQQS